MDVVNRFKSKASSIIDHLVSELSKIRVGRPTASVFDHVFVDAYGDKVPVSHLATISIADARTVVITPWDRSLLNSIYSSILSSDLGVNPKLESDSIKISFPPLTEEKRKEIAKLVDRVEENTKVSIRNLRRECLDYLDSDKKQNKLPDYLVKNLETELEKEVKNFVKKLEDLCDSKRKDIISF